MIRPADAAETVEAWKVALTRQDAPVALALTRQGLPILTAGVCRGKWRGAGGSLSDADEAQVVLIATGSEVLWRWTAIETGHEEILRVVTCLLGSFRGAVGRVSRERAPRRSLVSVEAGRTFGWERWMARSVHWHRSLWSVRTRCLGAEKLGVNTAAVVSVAKGL